MSNFSLSLSAPNWDHLETQKRLSVQGVVYLDENRVGSAQLLQHLDAAVAADELTAALQRLNGFYSWVYQDGERLFAAVDHVRSRPLFYGQAGDELYLSDDAEWVRQQTGDTEMDAIAREEFLLAGYVTGQETLYPKVKQLQAGEYLQAEKSNGKLSVKTHRYYRFWHTEPESHDEAKLQQKLESVTLNAMRRLTEYAAGRQLVIPLSGGYDSRLIATMLKRLDYKNVLCFSYGVPGNKEAEYSRKVAEALGFEWTFVEYSASRWREAWRTPEAVKYRKMAANHVSLPHVQDWLAIRELLKKEKTTNDSIIIPGHSGDFVAGSHIPKFAFEAPQHSEYSLLQALIQNHLSNAPKNGMHLADSKTLESRLRDRIASKFDGSAAGLANLYELWDWQERQSKYIVNSVRVYDQFEMDWWLPLWDIEFVKFWQEVPLEMRKERIWFKNWIDIQYRKTADSMESATNLGNAADQPKHLATLIETAKILPSPLQSFLKKIWRARKTQNHFLAFEGLVTGGEIQSYLSNQYNIIGIYSDLYIKSKW